MHPISLTLAAIVTIAAATPILAQSSSTAPVRFRAHDIADIRGGYAVAVADFDNDGRLDVVANSLGVAEVAWHENPTWERHVIVSDMPAIVNQAMADIDGDGIPEVAFLSAFAMQAANSEGLNWVARHRGDPREPWDVERVDGFETSHHLSWAARYRFRPLTSKGYGAVC